MKLGLWDRSCGVRAEGSELWDRSCEIRALGLGLKDWCCGIGAVRYRLGLWDQSCGQCGCSYGIGAVGSVGLGPWDRSFEIRAEGVMAVGLVV